MILFIFFAPHPGSKIKFLPSSRMEYIEVHDKNEKVKSVLYIETNRIKRETAELEKSLPKLKTMVASWKITIAIQLKTNMF